MNTIDTIFALDHAHPNYARWQRAIDASVLRGELVVKILSQNISLRGRKILDVGCGVGGTSRALEKSGASVIAIDINPERVAYVRNRFGIESTGVSDATELPFNNESFDAVILQDVIEHASGRDTLLREIFRVLKSDGTLYLSTPNRFSVLNIVADPHWGLPLIALLSRKGVRFFIHTLLKRETDRTDFAALLSLKSLLRLLDESSFKMQFSHRLVAKTLFDHPSSVVWSDAHLTVVRWIRRMRLHRLFINIVNDHTGFFNRFINPTWYSMCKKIPS